MSLIDIGASSLRGRLVLTSRGALAALVILAAAAPAHASKDPQLEHYKDIGHVTLSAGFGVLGESYLATSERPWVRIAEGTAWGMAPGILKEVVDVRISSEPRASVVRDLKQDLAGALVGAALSNVVRNTLGWSLSGSKQGKNINVMLTVPLN